MVPRNFEWDVVIHGDQQAVIAALERNLEQIAAALDRTMTQVDKMERAINRLNHLMSTIPTDPALRVDLG